MVNTGVVVVVIMRPRNGTQNPPVNLVVGGNNTRRESTICRPKLEHKLKITQNLKFQMGHEKRRSEKNIIMGSKKNGGKILKQGKKIRGTPPKLPCKENTPRYTPPPFEETTQKKPNKKIKKQIN